MPRSAAAVLIFVLCTAGLVAKGALPDGTYSAPQTTFAEL